MKFTIRQLQIFLAVAKSQNISRAADNLNMSQSAASEALLNLERAYDVKLFDRISNKLVLNNSGNSVRAEAEVLLARCKEFENTLAGHSDYGHIRVGASYTIGNHLVTRYLANYMSEYPNAEVNLETGNTPEIVAKVLNFEVDVGMIENEYQHRYLKLIPWLEDEMVVFCAYDHPLAKKKTLRLKDVRAARWILREPESGARYTFDKALASMLPDISIYLELQHNEAIKNAVESGLGIGCLSKIVLQRNLANGDLVPLRIPKCDMRRMLYFAVPRKGYSVKAVDEWMRVCSA